MGKTCLRIRFVLMIFLALIGWHAADTHAAQVPDIESFSPAEGSGGSTINDFKVVGVATNFNASTSLNFLCADITVNSITINSPIDLTASLSIAAETSCGKPQRNVEVRIDEDGDGNTDYISIDTFRIKNISIPVGNGDYDMFATIGEGVEDAVDGDTVLVNDGFYQENLTISKAISLVSRHGSEAVSLAGDTVCDPQTPDILRIDRTGVAVDGFTLANPENCDYNGVKADGVNGLVIRDLVMSGGNRAIWLANSSDNLIYGNILSNNEIGVDLYNVSSTTIKGNQLASNRLAGLSTDGDDYTHLIAATGNWWGESSGPFNQAVNPAGAGSSAIGSAAFSPWCAEAECTSQGYIRIPADALTRLFIDGDSYMNSWLLRADENDIDPILSATSLQAIQQFELILPGLSGTSSIFIPQGTIVRASNGSLFDATRLIAASLDQSSVAGLPEPIAGDPLMWGLPDFALDFDHPVSISLSVMPRFNGKALNIFSSHATSTGWTAAPLNADSCLVLAGQCVFTTNHASYFVATYQVPISFSNGGGGLPPEAYMPPMPDVGNVFTLKINGGEKKTDTEKVRLELFGGKDAATMLISEAADFSGASLQEYATTTGYRLSGSNGTKTVYAKFVTRWGLASPAVSARIIYQPNVPSVKGVKIYGEGSLLRARGEQRVYEVRQEGLYWIRSLFELARYYRGKKINGVLLNELSEYGNR